MIANETETSAQGNDLLLTRTVEAPPAKVYDAWTTPALLQQWFAPLKWTKPRVELDVRPGGSNLIVMRGPDGQEFPNRGVYLEVVKNERLVFTDAFTEAWLPAAKPFMTVVLSFEDCAGATRYTARVHHGTLADREAHEKMGFHQGWALCAAQLAALVEKSIDGRSKP